jgi:glutathione S-transferase
MAILYTFGPSHYCEKARWALDLCGVPYREERWAPGLHLLTVRRIDAGTTVPILDHGAGIIQGSCPIMDWLEAQADPPWHHDPSPDEAAEVDSLTARANDVIGPAVRRLIYATGLPSDPTKIARELLDGVARREKACAWAMWPVTRRVMMRSLRATAADIPDARATVEREVDALDTTLGDGRRFLAGGHLTRADIATASLLAPLALPRRHPVYRELAPWTAYRQIVERYRDRACVRWTTQIYDDCRYTG